MYDRQFFYEKFSKQILWFLKNKGGLGILEPDYLIF